MKKISLLIYLSFSVLKGFTQSSQTIFNKEGVTISYIYNTNGTIQNPETGKIYNKYILTAEAYNSTNTYFEINGFEISLSFGAKSNDMFIWNNTTGDIDFQIGVQNCTNYPNDGRAHLCVVCPYSSLKRSFTFVYPKGETPPIEWNAGNIVEILGSQQTKSNIINQSKYGNNDLDTKNYAGQILEYAEISPSFPGGSVKLMQFLSNNINYPNEAKTKGVEGKVVVRFIVDANGNIKNPQIIKGLGYGCDQEVIRVINSMPQWVAGKQDGIPVAVYYTIPVSFKFAPSKIK